MQATIPDLQFGINKIQAYESYYAISQWPGGWTGDMVETDPAEVLAWKMPGSSSRSRTKTAAWKPCPGGWLPGTG